MRHDDDEHYRSKRRIDDERQGRDLSSEQMGFMEDDGYKTKAKNDQNGNTESDHHLSNPRGSDVAKDSSRPFSCGACSLHFPTPTQYLAHIKTHTLVWIWASKFLEIINLINTFFHWLFSLRMLRIYITVNPQLIWPFFDALITNGWAGVCVVEFLRDEYSKANSSSYVLRIFEQFSALLFDF